MKYLFNALKDAVIYFPGTFLIMFTTLGGLAVYTQWGVRGLLKMAAIYAVIYVFLVLFSLSWDFIHWFCEL